MTMSPHRIFLLSPAHCGGERAKLLFRPQARFELAVKLRTPQGAMIGEVFAFLSGLYFRGKLAVRAALRESASRRGRRWAARHHHQPRPGPRAHVRDAEGPGKDGRGRHPRRRAPLSRAADAQRGALSESIGGGAGGAGGGDCDVILLGSVATGKYVDILTKHLGERLKFPAEFVGRGDMSRGGLMLRCVDEARELTYIPVAGAVRHGQRPPKLEKRAQPMPRLK